MAYILEASNLNHNKTCLSYMNKKYVKKVDVTYVCNLVDQQDANQPKSHTSIQGFVHHYTQRHSHKGIHNQLLFHNI